MAEDPNEMVRVQVTFTERVTYSQYYRMKRSDFEKYDAIVWGRGGCEEVIDRYLAFDRVGNWLSADDPEIDDFSIVEDEDETDEQGASVGIGAGDD